MYEITILTNRKIKSLSSNNLFFLWIICTKIIQQKHI